VDVRGVTGAEFDGTIVHAQTGVRECCYRALGIIIGDYIVAALKATS
jgi:hypothetical protein